MVKHLLKKLEALLRRLVGRPKKPKRVSISKAWAQWNRKPPKTIRNQWLDYSYKFRTWRWSLVDIPVWLLWLFPKLILSWVSFVFCYLFSFEFNHWKEFWTYGKYRYGEYKKWWRRNVWDIKVPLLFLILIIGGFGYLGWLIWKGWKPEEGTPKAEFLPVIFPLIVAAGFFIQAIFSQIRETWKRKEAERRIIGSCLYGLVKSGASMIPSLNKFHNMTEAFLGDKAIEVLKMKVKRIFKKDQENIQGDSHKGIRISHFVQLFPNEWDTGIRIWQKNGASKSYIEKELNEAVFVKELHYFSLCNETAELMDTAEPIGIIKNTKKDFEKINTVEINPQVRKKISTIINFHERDLNNSTGKNMQARMHMMDEPSISVKETFDYLRSDIGNAIQSYLNLSNQAPIDFDTYKEIRSGNNYFKDSYNQWETQDKRIKEELTKEIRLQREMLTSGSKS